MRILVITHRFPYPADKGDRIRGFTWLSALGSEHCVDLLTFADDSVDGGQIEDLIEKTRIRNVFPVRENRFGRIAYGVISAVSGFSLTEGYFYSNRFEQRLKELLRVNNYDACLAVCSSVGSYFLRVSPRCRTIVDFVDVDSYKWQLYSESVGGLRGKFYRRESEKIALLERRLMGVCDGIVVITSSEASRLEFSDVEVVGNPVGVSGSAVVGLENGGEIRRIVFVGQMDYFPNVDGVCWFARNVWPELNRRYGDLRFTIVGRNPCYKVRNLSKLEGVEVTGEVSDVKDYFKGAISVVPLRIVCGLQNKLIESLSCGVPVVASSGVALAADIDAGEGVIVAECVSDWVGSIARLKEEPKFAFGLGIAGRKAVAKRFSRAKVYRQMLNIVEGQMQGADAERAELVC